jgi:hypothetical protein
VLLIAGLATGRRRTHMTGGEMKGRRP